VNEGICVSMPNVPADTSIKTFQCLRPFGQQTKTAGAEVEKFLEIKVGVSV
jgi:hypothetical protein